MKMAEKRMICRDILRSDAFLEMPSSTQMLYVHLEVEADDDGFVSNPKTIIKIVGSSLDDLKILVAKKFVVLFESGVLLIRHWKIHNYIRSDRYKPTIFQDEMALLALSPQKIYEFVIPIENYVYTFGIPMVCIDKIKLDKIKLDKNNQHARVREETEDKSANDELKEILSKLNPKGYYN